MPRVLYGDKVFSHYGYSHGRNHTLHGGLTEGWPQLELAPKVRWESMMLESGMGGCGMTSISAVSLIWASCLAPLIIY